jgi:signal transduction histidine kinase
MGLGVIGCRADRATPFVNARLEEGGTATERRFVSATARPYASVFTLRACDRFFGMLSVHTQTPLEAEDAAAINAVAATLAHAIGLATMIVENEMHTASLEDKVASKTAELRARIRDMEDTRLAMWNMMSEAFEAHKQLSELTRSLEETVADRTKEAIEARNEALRATNLKSEFLSQVSHELRTPMHAIISFAKLSLKKIDRGGTEKVPEYLGQILGAAEELLALINDILDLSKIEAGRTKGHFEENDLAMLLRRLVGRYDPMLRENEVSVKLDFSRLAVERAVFDKQKMGQVLTNVFGNALKFSPRGGQITIEAISDPERVTISVADQGPGIPEAELEAIFDPFVQGSRARRGGQAKGTGLGLAIARGIVREHGGELSASTNPGGGALFTARFPATLPKTDPVA